MVAESNQQDTYSTTSCFTSPTWYGQSPSESLKPHDLLSSVVGCLRQSTRRRHDGRCRNHLRLLHNMGPPRRAYIHSFRKNIPLTLNVSSHSLMRRVRYTRGFPHGNGQCVFLPSFSSWGYLPLEHLSGLL